MITKATQHRYGTGWFCHCTACGYLFERSNRDALLRKVARHECPADEIAIGGVRPLGVNRAVIAFVLAVLALGVLSLWPR